MNSNAKNIDSQYKICEMRVTPDIIALFKRRHPCVPLMPSVLDDFDRGLPRVERMVVELEKRMQAQWLWIFRWLGIKGTLQHGRDFAGWVIDKVGAKHHIDAEIGSWRWEFSDGSDFGCSLFELFVRLRNVPTTILAIQEIKRVLRTIDEWVAGYSELHAEQGWTPLYPPGDSAPPVPDNFGWLGEPDALYEFRSPSGQLLFYTARFAQPFTGTRPLGDCILGPVTLWRDVGGSLRWLMRRYPGQVPLYGQEKLASDPDAPVILVVGEHVADRFPEFLIEGRRCIVVAIPYFCANGSAIDLTPLNAREVYLSGATGQSDQSIIYGVRDRMWVEEPSIRVGELRCTLDALTDDANEMLISLDTTGWTLADYKAFCIWESDRFKYKVLLSETRRLGDPVLLDKTINDFSINNAGVWVTIFKDGEPTKNLIASRIEIVEWARNVESQEWGVNILVRDPDGLWHRWCIPRSMLAGDAAAVFKTLLSLGAIVSPYPRLRNELIRYFLEVDPRSRALSVTKTGWHRHQFVLPDGSIVGKGRSGEDVVLQTQDPLGGNFVKQRGTLQLWHERVAMRCAGNSRLVLAICAVLAGPALSWLGEENGGFHFRGNSSIGKTTILYGACSVFGPPRLFMKLWRATSNGLEAVAASHNDLALVLDEMSQIEPTEAGQVAYMLANGQGRLRATQTGDARPGSAWKLIFLSSGEVGLREHIESAGGRVMAGQEARLIDIEADAGSGLGIFNTLHGDASGAEFSVALKAAADDAYGVAGRAWLSVLADPEIRGPLIEEMRTTMESFVTACLPAEADGQVARVARRFGLVAAVGEACIRHGILPWRTGEALAQCRVCFEDWLARRGGSRNLEQTQVIESVRRFLMLHGESRFSPMTPMRRAYSGDDRRPTMNRAGFRCMNDDETGDFLIFPDVYNREVCNGMNPRFVTTVLRESGYLVVDKQGKPQTTHRLPDSGPAKMYRIRASILSGDAVDEECDD